MDERTLLPELFNADELATFSSMADLKEKIDYYLSHEDERLALARRGQARVLKEHTYQQRMAALLDFIRAHRSDWPKARPQDAGVFAYLPEELKAPTAELLSRLDLPADTAFSDVVAAIRSGQGRLSELETSLLFLDEWKKQYG